MDPDFSPKRSDRRVDGRAPAPAITAGKETGRLPPGTYTCLPTCSPSMFSRTSSSSAPRCRVPQGSRPKAQDIPPGRRRPTPTSGWTCVTSPLDPFPQLIVRFCRFLHALDGSWCWALGSCGMCMCVLAMLSRCLMECLLRGNGVCLRWNGTACFYRLDQMIVW